MAQRSAIVSTYHTVAELRVNTSMAEVWSMMIFRDEQWCQFTCLNYVRVRLSFNISALLLKKNKIDTIVQFKYKQTVPLSMAVPS